MRLSIPCLQGWRLRVVAMGNVTLARRLDEILGDPALDAVAIATPVRTHYEIAVAALNAGKHVWLEKPMTEKSEEAWKLIELAEKRISDSSVDHTFVYTGAVRKMRELLVKGELGDIYYYDSIRVNLGLFQRDVSVISDLAVHDFSILDYLLAEQPIAVSRVERRISRTCRRTLRTSRFFTIRDNCGISMSTGSRRSKCARSMLGGSKRLIAYDDIATSEKVKVFDAGVQFTSDPEEIYHFLSAIVAETCGRQRSTQQKRYAWRVLILPNASPTGAPRSQMGISECVSSSS